MKKFFVSSKDLLELIKDYQALNYEGTDEWWKKSKSVKENPERLDRLIKLREFRIRLLEEETEESKK